VNRKQLTVVWLLAAWLIFSFFYASRHVEPPSLIARGKAKVTGAEPPAAEVSYNFVWDRDAGTFLMLAVPGLVVGIALTLTLGHRK
jgi:hypothetical protein